METRLINENIMLARAYTAPGSTKSDYGFSDILEQELLDKNEAQNTIQASKKTDMLPEKSIDKKNLVMIGELTENDPTVSNVLIKNPIYGKECWKIIYNNINQDKPYNRMLAGTKIYINPETKELVWGSMINSSEQINQSSPSSAFSAMQPSVDENVSGDTFSAKLVDAVKPYFGKNYDDINCYELIIKGLKKLGIKYQGAGGLGHQLIKMAMENGLPINAYFNGEGLIKASGSNIYSKSIHKVNNSEKQAMEIINELKPMLEKGQILSFSTPTKGHTGIISKKDDMWTYINSGDMDNSLGQTKRSKGVGEENLMEEVINWFRMAESRNENLKISLGRLNEEKLATYNTERKEVIKPV
ncbi:MAG: hypothetical protein KJ737_02635 [Proteobacteria bacterium]|nr:hypothetical protein [Pseudomonadota bacterium]